MKLSELEKIEREVVNDLWDSLGGLREYFTQISFTMTNYDQWQFKQKIAVLETQIQKLNQKIPRTKFRFKRKAEIQAKVRRTAEEDNETQDEWVKTIKGIVGQKDQTIKLTQSDLQDGSFKLVDLENCTVSFEGFFTMLFMRNLKNCTINTCPVANSIMGFNLHNCKISMIGHQIRLHDSEDVDFYVHTTSRLIIEDCTRLKFHELQYDYPGLQKDFELANLNKATNLWKEVQDFKWIKKEKSPNFELVFDGKEQVPIAEEKAVMYNPVVPSAPVPGKATPSAKPANLPSDQHAHAQEHRPAATTPQPPKEEPAKPKVAAQTQPAPQPVQPQTPTPAQVPAPTAPQTQTTAAAKDEDEDIDEI